MNGVPKQKKNLKRGLWIIVAIIAFLVIGGSGGWYYAAGKFDEEVENLQQRMLARNQIVDCENHQIRGFPFRIGVFCDSITIENPKKRQKLNSGAVRMAAQIYDPGKFILEFDGPAQFSDPKLGQFQIDWQSLRSSVRANLGGIERTSVVSNATTISNGNSATPMLSAETLELHARKVAEDDLELAIGGRNLILAIVPASGETVSKPFQISIQMTGNNLYSAAQKNLNLIRHIQENGGSGQLTSFKLESPDGGILKLTGPVSVGIDGQLSAKLEVSIAGIKSLIQFFSTFTPTSQKTMDQIELAVDMFTTKAESEEFRKFQIQINNGEVLLGLFPLGRIPPIF